MILAPYAWVMSKTWHKKKPCFGHGCSADGASEGRPTERRKTECRTPNVEILERRRPNVEEFERRRLNGEDRT